MFQTSGKTLEDIDYIFAKSVVDTESGNKTGSGDPNKAWQQQVEKDSSHVSET